MLNIKKITSMALSVLWFGTLALGCLALQPATSQAGGSRTVDSVNSESINKEYGMEAILCNILAFVSGGVGRTFAAFAVIFVGVGFISGKVAWATMITFAIGIAAIFGAPMVVKVLSGAGTVACDGFNGITDLGD